MFSQCFCAGALKMTDTGFSKGDVVKLKSGGPSMTITSVESDYGTLSVFVTWFDEKSKVQTDSFPVETVSKV
jgi:uncharacterized protein YodC (DUF2158 family)